ncbi:MAG: hypothetical protein ACKVRO_12485 [Micropepsaceae bacterium]
MVKDARVIVEYSLGDVVGSVEWSTECISIGKKERLFDETDDPIVGGRGYVLSRPSGWRSIDAATRIAVLFPELVCSEQDGTADWSDSRAQYSLPTVVLLKGNPPSQLLVLYVTRPQPILEGRQFTLRRVRFDISDEAREVTDLARVSEARLAAARWRHGLSQQINPFNPKGNEFDVATFFVLAMDIAEVKSVLPSLESVSIIAGGAPTHRTDAAKASLPVIRDRQLVARLRESIRKLSGTDKIRPTYLPFNLGAGCWQIVGGTPVPTYFQLSRQGGRLPSKNALKASTSHDSDLCLGKYKVPLSLLRSLIVDSGERIIIVDPEQKSLFELSPLN